MNDGYILLLYSLDIFVWIICVVLTYVNNMLLCGDDAISSEGSRQIFIKFGTLQNSSSRNEMYKKG